MVPVIDMDRTEIALEAWKTVDAIRDSEAYRAFTSSRDFLYGPDGPQAELAAFSAAKGRFDATAAVGKHHPDFARDAAALAEAKDALYRTEAYRRHAEALRTLNAMLETTAGRIRAILDSCLVGTKNACGKR